MRQPAHPSSYHHCFCGRHAEPGQSFCTAHHRAPGASSFEDDVCDGLPAFFSRDDPAEQSRWEDEDARMPVYPGVRLFEALLASRGPRPGNLKSVKSVPTLRERSARRPTTHRPRFGPTTPKMLQDIEESDDEAYIEVLPTVEDMVAHGGIPTASNGDAPGGPRRRKASFLDQTRTLLESARTRPGSSTTARSLPSRFRRRAWSGSSSTSITVDGEGATSPAAEPLRPAPPDRLPWVDRDSEVHGGR